MIAANDTPTHKGPDKDRESLAQKEAFYQYLQKRVATASMIAEATKIPQKNICRYKRELEKAGALAEVRRAYCEVTKHVAWYITTDKSKFPSQNQLTLF